MTKSDDLAYREATPFWREDEKSQNFGDFLTAYFLDGLVLRILRRLADIRTIGSYLNDYHIGLSKKRPVPEGLSQRAKLIAWAGGVRDPGGLSDVALEKVDVLSVRCPLSASAMRLRSVFPMGDPGLLMPAGGAR